VKIARTVRWEAVGDLNKGSGNRPNLKTVHAEAPLSGSIILAGLVLKLSVYGYLRILLPILPEACNYFSPLVMTMGAITIIHGALVTLRQVDTKAFVAQSSVSHMGTVILGLGASNIHGIEGAILLSIAHGLISPALFILVGGVLYDRYHSRTIRYYRGLGQHMPSFKL
jgi:NADH-ubiquinone oxidoreductase chain 4